MLPREKGGLSLENNIYDIPGTIPEGWLVDSFNGIPYDLSQEFHWDKNVLRLFEDYYKLDNYSIAASKRNDIHAHSKHREVLH